MKKSKEQIRTYELPHYMNQAKSLVLWDMYKTYQQEYKIHVFNYWKGFTSNKLTSFSHLGSTKHIQTRLNASYLQGCLAQACASLNNYLANIENKFKDLLNKSSIKDKDLLHQIRTINKNHDWLSKGKDLYYFSTLERFQVDDYGNVFKTYKLKIKTPVSIQAKRIAHKLFKHMEGNRVRFPNLEKPRFILDSRVVDIQKSDKDFDLWLNISTLTKGSKIQIPLKTHDYFNHAEGRVGNSIELNFITYPYNDKKEIKVYLNKKFELKPIGEDILNFKTRTVSFDLGLCTFIATSEGELLGRNWLEKLKIYDKKITTLAAARQIIGLKTRSRRYDGLINSVRGFIKSEINRILNKYFEKNQDIKEVVIEKLFFSNPNLSKRLNRIIKNFGQRVFKQKLEFLSQTYGFTIKELNPAYSSQECRVCGFVDKNNRKEQKLFKCLCCGHMEQADVQAGKVNLKRFQDRQHDFSGGSRGSVLQYLKERFVAKIDSLILNGFVSRRRLKELFNNKSSYFFDCTTEAQGVEPVTVLTKAVALVKIKLNGSNAVVQ